MQYVREAMRALARWQHPVASSEARDVLYWVMCPASYRYICMAIEITSELPAFFVIADLLLPTIHMAIEIASDLPAFFVVANSLFHYHS